MKKIVLVLILTTSLIACGKEEKCTKNYIEEIKVIQNEFSVNESLLVLAKSNVNSTGAYASINAIYKDMLERIDHILKYHKNELDTKQLEKLTQLRESFIKSIEIYKKSNL